MQDNILHLNHEHSIAAEIPQMFRVLSKEAEQYEFSNILGPLLTIASNALLFTLLLTKHSEKVHSEQEKAILASNLSTYGKHYAKASSLFLEYIASTVVIEGEPTEPQHDFTYYVTETTRVKNSFEKTLKTVPRMLMDLQMDLSAGYKEIVPKNGWNLYRVPDYLTTVASVSKLIEELKAALDEDVQKGNICRYAALTYTKLIAQGELLLEDMIMGAFDILTACSEACVDNVEKEEIKELLLCSYEQARDLTAEAEDFVDEIRERDILHSSEEEGETGALIMPFPSSEENEEKKT